MGLSKEELKELRKICSLEQDYCAKEVVHDLQCMILKEFDVPCSGSEISLSTEKRSNICTLDVFINRFWKMATEKILNVVKVVGQRSGALREVTIKERFMQYQIECKGVIIAEFAAAADAEYFLEWKRERMLWERNGEILDRIAKENGYDRKHPGLFPLSISRQYYDRAREQITRECFINQMIETDLMKRAKELFPEHDYYEAFGESKGGSYVIVTGKDRKKVYEVYYQGTEICSRCMDKEKRQGKKVN